jgi:transketolase
VSRALCWIYDSNRVTIEGHTEITFTEDVATRFLGYGWSVLHVRDASEAKEVLGAFELAAREQGRPTLIIIESHIGYGAPHGQDTAEAHGEPLGEDEVKLTKRFYGWPEDAQFLVPDGAYQHFVDGIGKRGAAQHAEWRALFDKYRQTYPDLAAAFEACQVQGPAQARCRAIYRRLMEPHRLTPQALLAPRMCQLSPPLRLCNLIGKRSS